MIDLHTHSTASDGTLTPSQLVSAATRAQLRAVALTDHDTVQGLDEFVAAAAGTRVRAVPGVELACSWYGGTLHVLGLFIDHRHRPLLDLLERIRGNRVIRNRAVLESLDRLARPLPLAEVEVVAAGEVVGRPHIAEAMVRRGYCRDAREAFELFLGEGKPAYVRRYLPLPAEAIAALRAAGGVTVWAHPVGARELTPAKLRQVGTRLRGLGLDAIEAFYPEFTPDQERVVQRVGRELGLLFSGGSDFHGANSPGVALGSGRGSLVVPDGFLRLLEARAHEHAAAAATADPTQPQPPTP